MATSSSQDQSLYQSESQSFLSKPITATCLCSAIQLELPPPTTAPESTYLCHCLQCRHVVGSLFAWQIRYSKEAVKFARGEDSITRWSPATDVPDPATGEMPCLGFCKVCGSGLFAMGFGSVIVRGGALDLEGGEKDGLRVWIEGEEGRKAGWWPKYEFFTKRKPMWFKQCVVEGAVQRKELSE